MAASAPLRSAPEPAVDRGHCASEQGYKAKPHLHQCRHPALDLEDGLRCQGRHAKDGHPHLATREEADGDHGLDARPHSRRCGRRRRGGPGGSPDPWTVGLEARVHGAPK